MREQYYVCVHPEHSNRNFVSREMEKYGVADRIGMTQDG